MTNPWTALWKPVESDVTSLAATIPEADLGTPELSEQIHRARSAQLALRDHLAATIRDHRTSLLANAGLVALFATARSAQIRTTPALYQWILGAIAAYGALTIIFFMLSGNRVGRMALPWDSTPTSELVMGSQQHAVETHRRQLKLLDEAEKKLSFYRAKGKVDNDLHLHGVMSLYLTALGIFYGWGMFGSH